MTDGNGNVTTYTYDDQNRVTGVSRKNGNETISNSISYDMGTDGKTMTSVKDANGHVNKEVTNEAGLTESTTDLGDGEEQITTAYSYDTNGNKIRETYADGGYKTFDYDRKNRLIKTESYEAGEAGESIGEKTLKTVYSYDINDRLLESIDYQIDGSEETAVRYTEYQYDSRGQTTGYAELSQENEPTADEIKAHQIRYHYDSDGKLTKVTYPTTKNGVQALAYEYDQNGWLTKIKGEVQSADTSTEKTVRSYTYDSYGKVKEIKDYRDLLNSSDQAVKKDYTYDSLDRVKEMTYTDLETGKVMESYQYSYDKNSNITKKTQVNNYPKEDADKVNETKVYTYDTFGRLVKTVMTDHKKNDQTKTITYTYDNVGNRLKEDNGTTTTSYTYNGLDQLKTSTKEKGTAVEEVRQYDYDANGNQTDVKNTKTGENQTYVYDAENRLSQVSVTKDGNTAVIQQNIYNGEGQRIQKIDGDETINYYYQDGVVAYTTDTDGNQNSQNLIGTEGNVLATERFKGDDTQYYLYNKDIQGSTSSLVKEDGSADATYQYTDFGETTIQGDDQAKNEVCYTGGIYDQSTGLYYLNARYYNPEDGRFMTEDTYRGDTTKSETGHLYVYCANNPVNYVDPSGHIAVKIANAVAGAIVGTVVDTSLKAFIYYIAKKGSLKGFKVSPSETFYSAMSGLVDGVLISTRLKRNAQVIAGSIKAAIVSCLSNRKKNISKILTNALEDAIAGGAAAFIGGKSGGLGRQYWNRGLFRKGSYTYKHVTIKYGTTIKITSRSFKMTKQVAIESGKEFARGAAKTAVITGVRRVINFCRKHFAKK